jgi:hemolysin III
MAACVPIGLKMASSPPEDKKFDRLPTYTPGETLANIITHGLGMVLSIVGVVFIVYATATRGDLWHIVSTAIYGSTLVILYGGSTVYHSIRSPAWRHFGKILDQCSIYLLIAGTYPPFTLVTLRGPWGWSLFGIVWGLAIVGIIMEAWWVYRPEMVSTGIYLLMGWIVVFAIKPLSANLPEGGLTWLVAGGISYSVGTLFFLIDRKIRYMHAVWHLFVLGGSVCHFFAIAFYVVP